MLKNIASAFQFLTVLPVPVKTDAENLQRSMVWFPLVGAVVGCCTGFGFELLHYSLNFTQSSSAALTIFIYILVTRGLHLDGFMDTIDGFFSRKDSQTILKIMKEPAVGSFAVSGLGVWFLLLFSSIPTLNPVDLILLHTMLRFQVLLPPLFVSYPRESGTGKFFVRHVNKKTVSFAFITVLIIGAAIYLLDEGSQRRLPVYIGCLVVSLVMALITAFWAKKKINGITGDVLGFTIESTHMLLVVIIPWAMGLIRE